MVDWFDPPSSVITGIKTKNGNIYTLSQPDGLEVWNNYTSPEKSSEFRTLENVNDINLIGDYVIVSFGSSNWFSGNKGLFIFDISSNIPELVNSYNRSWYSDYYLDDKTAYFLDSNYLEIIDLSDPANPVQTSNSSIGGTNLYVDGDYVYIYGNGGLDVIDVSDKTNPTVVSHVMGIFLREMTIVNDIGYVISISGITYVLDLSDPEYPKYLYSLEVESTPYVISSYGNFLFVGQYEWSINKGYENINRIEIFDTTNPYSLERVGLLNINSTNWMGSQSTFDITQDSIFMALGSDGYISINWNVIEEADNSDGDTPPNDNDDPGRTNSSTPEPPLDDSESDGGFLSVPISLGLIMIALLVIYRKNSNNV